MRIILTISLCLLFALPAAAQNGEPPPAGERTVTALTLARTDRDGNIEENPDVFAPGDVPLHCYIDLSAGGPALVRMTIYAVKAKGLRPNSAVVTVRYRMKEEETGVTFTASPGKTWPVGQYRVEVLVDTRPAAAKEFRVEGQQ